MEDHAEAGGLDQEIGVATAQGERIEGAGGMKKLRRRRRSPASPPIGALMRYGERIVRVVAEARGQRAVIESNGEDGRVFRSNVKWASLEHLGGQLF
ncbi:hypothetical protein [Paraburkholderia sp. GAS334]|uniref:hypothetical protein n=1 Tax=Paraburkholderia sp. GAS334 TaxID=3035131 RepID=UPI003D1FA0EE